MIMCGIAPDAASALISFTYVRHCGSIHARAAFDDGSDSFVLVTHLVEVSSGRTFSKQKKPLARASGLVGVRNAP